tara:strand:+ start:780 stop:1742 length:963 start_codon:yes stop_codon:yes gene_type:complete
MAVCGFIGQGLIGQKRLSSIEVLNEKVSFIVDPLASSSKYKCYKDISDVPDELIDSTSHLFIAIPHYLVFKTFSFFSDRVTNFLIEKPMGINLTKAQEITKLSNQNNNNIFCGFNYRYLPHIQSLKKDIASGDSGEIYYCSFSLSHGGRPDMSKEWKMKKDMAGGGALIDPGVHLFDLMNYLFNPKVEVISSSLENYFWRNCDVEDFAKVVLKDKSTGIVFDFEINLFNWKNSFEIKVFGKDKTYFLDGRGGNYGDQAYNAVPRWHWQRSDVGKDQTNFGSDDNSFFQETIDFLNPSSSDIIASSSSGLDALEIIDKIYR